MARRDKAPKIMVERTRTGLVPCTAYDCEMLDNYAPGQLFELGERSRRSNPQLNTYWLALDRVVKATGHWPTKEHLSDELKKVCGYFSWSMDLETGEMSKVPDSISFGAMGQTDFRTYFDAAMAKLAEAIGYDPLHFLGEAA